MAGKTPAHTHTILLTHSPRLLPPWNNSLTTNPQVQAQILKDKGVIIGWQTTCTHPLLAHSHPSHTLLPSEHLLRLQVQAQIPKDKGVIIGCQKGLRSLAAAEQLSRAGYGKVAWINGGFDTARPGEFKTTNGRDIRCGVWGLGCQVHFL